MKLVSSWVVAALAALAAGSAISHKLDGFTIREHANPAKRALLQKYVRCEDGRLTYSVVLMSCGYR